MTDSPDGRNEEPYEPFPSFDIWATVAFDSTTVDLYSGLLSETKQLAEPEQIERAVLSATRSAAVDTGAIEGLYDVDRGFTMSVAVNAAAWDAMHERVGHEAEQAIHDAVAGYEYVLDMTTKTHPVTEQTIKELHATLCASQDTYKVFTDVGFQDQSLPKGEYKRHANSPFNLSSETVHAYAPVSETIPEMARLVTELRSKAFAAAHPVIQAAYAHYAFVCIHPFADGNGRVARALASVYLYRSPGVPLVVFADQKADYLAALELADDGEYAPFMVFIGECVIETAATVRVNISRPARPSLAERMAMFRPVLTGRGGIRHEEIDALGARLNDLFALRIDHVSAINPLEAPFNFQRQVQAVVQQLPDGYRSAPSVQPALLTVNVSGPGFSSASHNYYVGISRPDRPDLSDFIIATKGRVVLEVRLRDIHPNATLSLQHRLDLVIEDEIGDLLDSAARKSEKKLGDAGYIEKS